MMRISMLLLSILFVQHLSSCKSRPATPGIEAINEMKLKKGQLILCGPPETEFGNVSFESSCPGQKKELNLAIAILHSFEYTEAEKAFTAVIERNPDCAMAYWGIAMCNYHQVWPAAPSSAELEKGSKALAIARSIAGKTVRETTYIEAMAAFFENWKTVDHRSRSLRFLAAMEKLQNDFPNDMEASVFYALTLIGTADASDRTFGQQKKAGELLINLQQKHPTHPGIVHYIIHAFDSPELAAMALSAARRYAAIAPSSSHAQHMPSHIFTRLGLWDECIKSNLAAVSSAQCYAEAAGIKGHWDEELHALDYLVYGYLQKGDNRHAKEQFDYLRNISSVEPMNFKVSYAFAAIPSRYYLENRMWKEAANLNFSPAYLPWKDYPWQKAIIHFARGLGAARINKLADAKTDLMALRSIHDSLIERKDAYKANQVLVQAKTIEAWIRLAENKKAEALQEMMAAAALEDKTEKSPVTPGEILPANELLADMLLILNKPEDALAAYQADLTQRPNRFNGLYGAALASDLINDQSLAHLYYQKLDSLYPGTLEPRQELQKARTYLTNSLAKK